MLLLFWCTLAMLLSVWGAVGLIFVFLGSVVSASFFAIQITFLVITTWIVQICQNPVSAPNLNGKFCVNIISDHLSRPCSALSAD